MEGKCHGHDMAVWVAAWVCLASMLSTMPRHDQGMLWAGNWVKLWVVQLSHLDKAEWIAWRWIRVA